MSGIRLRGLTRSFGSFQVLRGIDLDIDAGSVTAILGPSGCGKTTLLRLIAGFDAPDSGTIDIAETSVFGPGRLVPPQRRHVGYVAQEGALFPHLTVAGNLAFGLPERGAAGTARIQELLELVGLDGRYAGRYPHELSGGQQQRVALARALAARPAVVLLDEPFSSLDAALREGTRRAIIRALASTHTTTVLVTHDQAEALSVADQVGVLFDGVLAQVGAPAALYGEPASVQVGTFLGEANVLAADIRAERACCEAGLDIPLRRPCAVGPGMVLVRPEQVVVVPVGTPGSVSGRVTETTFYGPSARVEIMVGPHVVVARTPGFQEVPRAGDAVGVVVQGKGVGFPAPA
jgi:iron(III) transport system ATP-binding protein